MSYHFYNETSTLKALSDELGYLLTGDILLSPVSRVRCMHFVGLPFS